MVIDDDDPRAPYKVYEGDELKGTYTSRASLIAATARWPIFTNFNRRTLVPAINCSTAPSLR